MNRDHEPFKLAASPHIWTNDDWPEMDSGTDIRSCLREIQRIGFEGCEAGVRFPKNKDAFDKLLSEFNLTVCNKWNDLNLTTQHFDEEIRSFKERLSWQADLCIPNIGVAETSLAWFKEKNTAIRPGDSSHRRKINMNLLTERLNILGQMASDRGISLCYHPHVGTVIQQEEDVLELLDGTDPAHVHLIFDPAHYLLGGIDPVDFLNRHFSRIGLVHLKDTHLDVWNEVVRKGLSFYDAILSGLFSVPGHIVPATINFPAIIDILIRKNYTGWVVVEGDRDPRTYHPLAMAKKSYDYLYQLIHQTRILSA